MSSKQSRHSSSTSSPSSPPSNHSSKLPKFLQKSTRDRSKSLVDPGHNASSSSSSSSSNSPPSPETSKAGRKASKKGSMLKEWEEEQHPVSPDVDIPQGGEVADETPVIVEPVNIPRPRTRSERPMSENYPSVAYYPSSSSSRLSDIPTRLSGWFSHTFSSSTTDLSLPALLSQQHLASSTSSPKGKGSALLTAARHGKGHIDKAMRYLLDSDSTPDKCSDPIWLLGVEHAGYEPPPAPPPFTASKRNASVGRRNSIDSRRSPSSVSSSASSPIAPSSFPGDPSLSQSHPTVLSPSKDKDPSRNWPPAFYADFTSRIWLTYRSQFLPIRDTSLSALESDVGEAVSNPSSPQPKKWNWPLVGEKGWTSDAGWGCMLRTGQSLLANTLLHLHLGRDWRRPPYPIYTADYATYVQIITWFLDNPSPLCPFSVHRMALVGKDLGKEVGQWFGPSTAAGAIRTLVHAFPDAALGVSVASDGAVYESDVFAASRSSRASLRRYGQTWGDRAVLVLIGIRLGLDGVNPIYYNTIKALYEFPQSVGIAGGRPSSSYYFVGSQADNLFYLDPHHARPAIPLRPPPRSAELPSLERWERQTSPGTLTSDYGPVRVPQHTRSPTAPSVRSSAGSASSVLSQRSPPVPSPLQQQQLSTSSSNSTSQSSSAQSHARWQSSSALPDDSELDSRDLGIGADLDPLQLHYVTAYSAAELKTFHCDRVRKMPLSGLDPSMLLGFLCKDENDWKDFRKRMNDLSHTHKTIFTIQDEPPSWPSDSDDNMGLESISEPDIDMPEDDDEDALDDDRSSSTSPDTSVSVQDGGAKSEADTEEDPVGPITPGAGKNSLDIPHPAKGTVPQPISRESSLDFDDDEDEEWMDPSTDTPPLSPDAEVPPPSPSSPPVQVYAPPLAQATSTGSTISASTHASGKKRRKFKSKKSGSGSGSALPEPQMQFPFPATQAEEPLSDAQLEETRSKRIPQMRTAKARDGGRTQSGGVRGVPADDMDDF
ncbi:peptidase family C54-domain-containing protein [Sparassis latifolia]|uniref:Cysteine protease n=1 Tax=Sparassis crispa TaxID=139825 RepID=A0A401G931_9APHY|nr:Cysteine protease ATG4 [Sparassis crispa]GBE78643.1 Cysteine protease ATG4 [Sparassis crispa]